MKPSSFSPGITSDLSYVPSTGPQSLFPKASFNTCTEEDKDEDKDTEDVCPGGDVSSVETTVSLETSHIGKGCDRDTYSLWSQRRLCGASQEAVDLLPPSAAGEMAGADDDEAVRWGDNCETMLKLHHLCHPVKSLCCSSRIILMSFSSTISRDIGYVSDRTITRFNGRTGLEAPTDTVRPGEAFPGMIFTLATWMKHAKPEEEDKHKKEHIICKADDHSKFIVSDALVLPFL